MGLLAASSLLTIAARSEGRAFTAGSVLQNSSPDQELLALRALLGAGLVFSEQCCGPCKRILWMKESLLNTFDGDSSSAEHSPHIPIIFQRK